MFSTPVKPIFTTLFFLLTVLILPAQDKNPFQSIGKKGKIITLTNGKYEELFDQDSIQQIGTALVNIRQMKVVKLLEDKEAQKLLDNSASSRFLSVDPLARNFAWNSPYAYAENSPVKFIDLDGAEKYDPAFKPTGVTHVQLATVPISTQDARLDYSIKAGPYQLYPVSDPSGKRNAYWLARYTFTEGPYAGMHRDDWIVGTDGVGDFVKNGQKYYNKAGWIERFGGANQEFNLASLWKGYKESWNPQNVAAGLTLYLGGLATLTPKLNVGTRVSAQKQARHLSGNAQGNLNVMASVEEAQEIVDALHSGKAKIVDFKDFGKKGGGVTQVDVEYSGVTGNFSTRDLSTGEMTTVPTNIFRVEGTGNKVKVFPINPNRKK